jgi:5-(carboxyamino)imidazole ribonucleotide synthase
MIVPDATLGMLGGGQLGRMFTLAAHSMGYRVAVLDPDPYSPARAVADIRLENSYEHHAGLQLLVEKCDAVTTEFENVPAESLRWLANHAPVRPSASSVALLQDRIFEKTFLTENGFPIAPFVALQSNSDCDNLDPSLLPGIVKRARFGYDGKGQIRVATTNAVRAAFASLGSERCVLEKEIGLACEISVVAARGADGITATFPVAENEHQNGILDISIVPARVSAQTSERAEACARAIADTLRYCGVLAVEYFVATNGDLLVNEIAPRPHNSGHYTIDACGTSQFEQQVRTLCELPLGETQLRSPVVMVNLLGDIWDGGRPDWKTLLECPGAKLHLYGKHEARPGRKMGHYTVVAESVESALNKAQIIRSSLRPDLTSIAHVRRRP